MGAYLLSRWLKILFFGTVLLPILMLTQNCGTGFSDGYQGQTQSTSKSGDGVPFEGKIIIEAADRVNSGDSVSVKIYGGDPPYEVITNHPDVTVVSTALNDEFTLIISDNASPGRFQITVTDQNGVSANKDITILGKNKFMYDPSSLTPTESGQSLYAADTAIGRIHEIDFDGELIQSIDHPSAVFYPTKVTSTTGGGLLVLNRNGSIFYRSSPADELANMSTMELIDYFYYQGQLVLVAPRGEHIRVAFPQNFDFTNLSWLPIDILAREIQSMGLDEDKAFWVSTGGRDVVFYNNLGEATGTKTLHDEVSEVLSGTPIDGHLVGKVKNENSHDLVSNPFLKGPLLVQGISSNANETVIPVFRHSEQGLFTIVRENYNRFIRVYSSPDKATSTEWSSAGSRALNFSHPCSIDIDQSDSIYLSDQANNRVSKFNSQLEFLFSAEEKFLAPEYEPSTLTECFGDIHLLFDQYPLIAKGKLGGLAKELTTGAETKDLLDQVYCTKAFQDECPSGFGEGLTGPYQTLVDNMKTFGRITSAATSPDQSFAVVFGKMGGSMFVLRKTQPTIYSDFQIEEVSLRDSLGVQFADRVIDSAIGSDGTIYILTGQTLNEYHLHAINQQGQIQFSFAPKRILDPEPNFGLYLPRAMALDTENNLIAVADSGEMLIRFYSAEDGSHQGDIGDKGIDALMFRRPMGVAINSKGDLVVSDTGNNRLQVIEDYLQYLNSAE